MGKCGGSAKQLEDAIKCGRVIKGMAGKLEMFFFPRRQYAREKLVKQGLLGIGEKQTDDIQNLDLVAEAESDWDPSTLVAQGLQDITLGGLALPSSSSQSLMPPPLTMPSPAGHYIDQQNTHKKWKEPAHQVCVVLFPSVCLCLSSPNIPN